MTEKEPLKFITFFSEMWNTVTRQFEDRVHRQLLRSSNDQFFD